MKNIKLVIGSISLIWLLILGFTFSHSIIWYAYFFLTGTALLLSFILLFQLSKNKQTTKVDDRPRNVTYQKPLQIPHLFNRIKKKRKISRNEVAIVKPMEKSPTIKDVTENNSFMKQNQKMSSVKNKRYLHTRIPLLFQGTTQKILFETIQRLKDQHFFYDFYGNLSNEELIQNFELYVDRPIFELYDQTLPNTFAKTLYDPETESNRIAIFLPSNNGNETDIMLGFIEMEDTYKANLLMQRYANIQVFTTILGGTYKKVYQNEKNEIKMIKDFVNYDLTISLAFYNN